MNVLLEELSMEFRDSGHLIRVILRLLAAVLVGSVMGFERLKDSRGAGLRTHVLVALGSAIFTLTALEGGMHVSDLSRVIQGIAAGIGFLGAGNILKLSDEHRVEGLTSAASIWLTAAAGMAVGAGWMWSALLGVAFAWVVLKGMRGIDHRYREEGGQPPPVQERGTGIP
jgi:putative Mg2+ transporter-C (MgtC) family protein